MADIIIKSISNGYLLTGEGLKIIDRRMLFHLKRVFNAIEREEDILIPVTENEEIISKLNEYLLSKNINLFLDSEANEELTKKFDDEKYFQEFSKKAKKIWDNEVDKIEFENFCDIIDKKLVRKLYPLQLLSSYHLAYSQNACNFSVPGAGKTSIVYGAYSFLNSLSNDNVKFVDKILVIGPLSSFGPWENEYEDCFGKSTSIKRISGGNLSSDIRKKYFYSRNTAEITLISYQGILNQKENIEFFLKNNNVMIILDEAHKIKNTTGGQIAESILSFAKWAKGRVVLTGTPAPNGYRDLYNLFKFIWPNKEIISFSLNQLDEIGTTVNDPRVKILVEDLSPYFVRIKKKDLGLPDKKENDPIVVTMEENQRIIYEKIERKVLKDLQVEEEGSTSFLGELKKAKIIRLMQAASNPRLLIKPLNDNYLYSDFSGLFDEDEEIVRALTNYKNLELVPPKFETALKIIKEIISKGEKVIVWAIYVDTINQFADYLHLNEISSKILYGKTKIESDSLDTEIETRESIVRDFHKENSEFKVIIANPFAVAESISLHKACHSAIYLERNFDAARYVQSKDRIHRYGLSMDTITNYYYLNTEFSIDMIIDQRLREKEQLMINITESAEIPLFTVLEDDIDNNDIKALIEAYANRG